MPVPQVAIVGRPNVGKSSLLNWLAGKKISIVDDVAGVTRDRVSYLMDERGRFFEIVDTGGIGIVDADNLSKQIEDQIETAIESADVILFVVDTKVGVAPLDDDVAKRLRYVDKPVICVANKTDHENLEPEADIFHKFGRKLVRVSVRQNRNKDELLHAILERLPPQTIEIEPAPEEPVMKMAIVGRRNTGKSTFVNTLARAERMIVSEVAGTTRDSVDVRFELDGKTFMAIDTPGLKRTRSVRTDIDFYSYHRAQRSIRRADVVLMFFDCSQRLSKVDKQLVSYIGENYRPCIFVVNKWDKLVGQMPTERWVEYLRDNFPSMWHVPIAFITGQTGKNVKALLNHAQMLFKQSLDRVSTSELNKLVRAAIAKHPPAMSGIVRPKIYYATQVSTQPPTIVLICNQPKAFSPSYRRYLLGIFRDHLKFGEVPIKLYLQKRRRDDTRDDLEAGKDDEAAQAAVDAMDLDSAGVDDELDSLSASDDVHEDESNFHLRDEESGVR